MSDESGTQDIPAGSPEGGPRPEPIRFFGTAWVHHDNGYPLRRVGVATGSLAAAVASCLILRFAYEGLQIADTGSFVTVLVIAMFAICAAASSSSARLPREPERDDCYEQDPSPRSPC